MSDAIRVARLHLVLILIAALAVAVGLGLAARGSDRGALAAVVGALLAGAAMLVGFWAILRAWKKDQKAFIRALFGGMLLRLSGYVIALAVVHLATSWSLEWFAAGMLGAHLLGQGIEVDFMIRKVRKLPPVPAGPQQDDPPTGP